MGFFFKKNFNVITWRKIRELIPCKRLKDLLVKHYMDINININTTYIKHLVY
jgi:hypothetical protein